MAAEEESSNPKSSFLESEMSVVEEEKDESMGGTLEVVSNNPAPPEPDIEDEFDALET